MAVSKYWNKQFAKFDKNGGKFVRTWSWCALIFNVLWYAWKGMWAKLFILVLLMTVLGGLLPPEKQVSVVLLWLIYPAMFGKWDYYLLKKRGTRVRARPSA